MPGRQKQKLTLPDRYADPVTMVYVGPERKPRRVFYVRRGFLFDGHGRYVCPTPLELAACLGNSLSHRDAESVDALVWDALNFIYDGDVPDDWLTRMQKMNPVPLAI